MGILDPKDAYFGVDDDFLDFTLEGEAEEDKDPKTILKPADVSSSSPTPFSHETQTGSFPEFVEEELEWLSNKDAFPPIETCFGILSDSPELLLNHHSPVSVLDNVSSSNSNINSNDNGSTSAKVPTKFPVRARSTNRKRRGRANFGGSLSQQILGLNQVNVENRRGSAKSSRGGRSGRRCSHCETDKTPQWREGPKGPRTLCNACGVRFRSGRLVPEYRPVRSPTFSSELHSNFHRKVVEMRKKDMEKGGDEQ